MQGAIGSRMSRPILAAVAGSGVLAGLAARAADLGAWAAAIWTGVTLPVLAALVVEVATSLRRGDVGLDLVAAISMSGALALNEPLAAAVVAVMYAGGQALESVAQRRAGREMTALLARAPRAATRQRGEALEEVPQSRWRRCGRAIGSSSVTGRSCPSTASWRAASRSSTSPP